MYCELRSSVVDLPAVRKELSVGTPLWTVDSTLCRTLQPYIVHDSVHVLLDATRLDSMDRVHPRTRCPVGHYCVLTSTVQYVGIPINTGTGAYVIARRRRAEHGREAEKRPGVEIAGVVL